MKTKTKTEKTRKADAPMTRSEFKDAISKMTRNELIGILCDIYYANAKDGSECNCDCGCESQSKKTSAKAKRSVKRSAVAKKK
jgi:hypothetical protein